MTMTCSGVCRKLVFRFWRLVSFYALSSSLLHKRINWLLGDYGVVMRRGREVSLCVLCFAAIYFHGSINSSKLIKFVVRDTLFGYNGRISSDLSVCFNVMSGWTDRALLLFHLILCYNDHGIL